jgi:NAD(P)-dependent dehydrogenase (short-subunit alcohol dehydrogenase family)
MTQKIAVITGSHKGLGYAIVSTAGEHSGGDNAPFTVEEGAETAVYLATLPEGGT